MEASSKRAFHYRAGASPLGGHITHPTEKIIHTQGASSLAQAGGHVESRVGPFRLDNIVSCNQAYSHSSGVQNRSTGSWEVVITSVVEQLNVLEVVTADRVVSRLFVEHPHEGYNPRVSAMGSSFVNLRVAGVSIEPVLDLDLLTLPVGKDGFPTKLHVDDEKFVDKVVEQTDKIVAAKSAPQWLKGRHSWVKSPQERKKKGFVLCSLVNELRGAKPGTSHGHVMHVPGFGNVFFGELVIAPHSYRLTMIRTEMGCLAEGTISAGTADSNGFTVP
jgi:hypothetical protein